MVILWLDHVGEKALALVDRRSIWRQNDEQTGDKKH